jgi:sugar phosphate isomerase/epimerase
MLHGNAPSGQLSRASAGWQEKYIFLTAAANTGGLRAVTHSEVHLYPLGLAPTTLPHASPLDYIEAAAFAGFPLIGLRLNPSPGLPYQPLIEDPALVKSVHRRIGDAGLRVLDVYSFYMTPDVDIEAFRPAVELSAKLGARYLMVMGADSDWSRMRDNFAAMCDLAASCNLACALECAVMRPLASLPQAVRLAQESGRANVAICIDPLNFLRAGDTADDLRAFDPKLFPFAQLTDGLLGPGEPDKARLGRMGPNQRRMLGEGVVPLDDILDALPAGIPLSVELPAPDGSTASAREWAKVAHDNARDYLARRSA